MTGEQLTYTFQKYQFRLLEFWKLLLPSIPVGSSCPIFFFKGPLQCFSNVMLPTNHLVLVQVSILGPRSQELTHDSLGLGPDTCILAGSQVFQNQMVCVPHHQKGCLKAFPTIKPLCEGPYSQLFPKDGVWKQFFFLLLHSICHLLLLLCSHIFFMCVPSSQAPHPKSF